MEEYEADTSSASAAEVLSYRQRLEKPTGGEIVLMQWSPTMDLLAATFADNSVILNRLSWQRVWSQPPQDHAPTALEWRPDGKVLAVGRADGSVALVSVEEGRTLHTHTLTTHHITSLHWMTQDEASIPDGSGQYRGRASSFLPPLPTLGPTLDSSSETAGSYLSDEEQVNNSLPKELNVLVAGDRSGALHICIGGVFCATSTASTGGEEHDGGQQSHVMVTCLSRDLKMLSAVSLAPQQHDRVSLQLHTVEVSLLHQRCRELQYLALHYSSICSLLSYTRATLRCMHEAWEDLLLMVDAKLTRYASTLPEGTTVADELLILLACGRVRPELQDFLVDELTAKGVKKIGLSLEMSYTRVRKYSLTSLSSVIQALQFHLGEVLGMSRWHQKFGTLGLSDEKMQVCLNSLGTFALKNQELQFVIDESLKSMKAFFTWLYLVILKLGEESIPPGMKQHLSAEELKQVIHFLKKRLAQASEGSSQTFNLEVVGQYLVDEDLKIVEEKPPSLWEKILEEAKLNPEVVSWLFQPDPKKSLLQLFKSLNLDIDAAFATTETSMRESFLSRMDTTLYSAPMLDANDFQKTTSKLTMAMGEFLHDGNHCVYFPSENDICLLQYSESEQGMKCCRFCVQTVPPLLDQEESGEPLSLTSVQVYSSEALSLLFQYSSSERQDVHFSAVAQLPLESLTNLEMVTATADSVEADFECCECHDVGHLLTQVQSLGPFLGTGLAVSGSRRLAAVVSHSKKVRLFDVDAEADEEEDTLG